MMSATAHKPAPGLPPGPTLVWNGQRWVSGPDTLAYLQANRPYSHQVIMRTATYRYSWEETVVVLQLECGHTVETAGGFHVGERWPGQCPTCSESAAH